MRETAVDIFTGSVVDVREALYPFKAKDVLPLVRTGTINRFNIGEMIRFNQARWRAHFEEKDRVDGAA